MAHPIRVLITDDHARSRNSLRALLATWPEIEVVGEAANGHEAVRRVGEWQPDVVLMDVRMPVLNAWKPPGSLKINGRGLGLLC
jgi:YesN/AraC family two-component response regulator